MGTWEILLTSNTPALLAGGSAGLFWSVCWAYCGQFFVVLSLAEMSSMAPTAGAQYHWISLLAPAEYQRLLSYLSGWLSTISWQSIVALDCYLVGTIIQGLITVNDETYVAAKWQATLLIIAVAIFITLFNIFAAKHLPLAEGIFVTGHFFAFFPVVIILLVLAPKRSTKDVFLTFSDNGAGWPNVGLSTLVGQVSAIFSVLGSDSVAHMAEEVQDSSIVVPRAMTWSFIVNIPSTIGLLLTYLYCMPSVSDAVSHSSGYPFLYVFQEATGSASGATGLAIVILLLLAMITISAAASTSRQTFAFARDHGLPFSTWLSTVSRTSTLEARQLTCSGTPEMACSCKCDCLHLYFHYCFELDQYRQHSCFQRDVVAERHSSHGNICVSSAHPELLFSTNAFRISIGCVIDTRRRRTEMLPHARWSLGRYGMPINIISLVYSCWSFFCETSTLSTRSLLTFSQGVSGRMLTNQQLRT